ncbi:MAG TPA: hypothetical protein VFQ02_03870, partial [Nitrospira sp.]|nr:hypothetical protein [Nitrospira sp.]
MNSFTLKRVYFSPPTLAAPRRRVCPHLTHPPGDPVADFIRIFEHANTMQGAGAWFSYTMPFLSKS